MSGRNLCAPKDQTKIGGVSIFRPRSGEETPRSGLAASFVCGVILLVHAFCGCAAPGQATASSPLYSPKDARGSEHGGSRFIQVRSQPDEANAVSGRRFDFDRDTFAYANELLWEYTFDEKGTWTTHTRELKPSYYQHCFVMARSARQFFDNARFDPSLPQVDESIYRERIRRVVKASPRRSLPEAQKILFPGYADLRSFSREHEASLKHECGSATQSYIQIGNWRTIFPFTRGHQERMARQLVTHLRSHRPVLVHVLRFPQLSINHALLLFDAKENPSEIDFSVYDPNNPAHPAALIFDRAARLFRFPPNNYFFGGTVNVYEIYWRWNY